MMNGEGSTTGERRGAGWAVMCGAALGLATALGCGGGATSTTSPISPTPPVPTSVSLSGTVSSTSGLRLASATVRILDGQNGGRSATTNGTGEYRFDSLSVGNGNLAAEAPGYQAAFHGLHLNGGSLNFTLPLSGPAPYVGRWSGTTSVDNKPITFEVQDNAVVSLAIGFVGACGVPDGTRNLSASSAVGRINNNTFGFQQTTAQPQTSISGTFRSSTSATGTHSFTITSSSGGITCSSQTFNRTWTATRQ